MVEADLLLIYALVALGAPLGGALINGLLGSWTGAGARWIGLGAMVGFGVAAGLLGAEAFAGRALDVDLYTWISSGEVEIAAGVQVDGLTAALLAALAGVGLAVHVYAARGAAGALVFCLLNLSTFAAALVLVANSYGLVYVGWGLLGVCSYLLVGGGEGAEAREAARRAFVVDRVGDAALGVGLLLLLARTGSLGLEAVGVLEPADEMTTWIGLLFFLGAATKAAQVPLHFWLVHAMAGPAPANALVHAGAMGMAGAYLLVRVQPLYALSPTAGQVVAVAGMATALLAALMALAAADVKQVLAHSTTSQLGLVFAAAGLGECRAGVFHLLVHTFCKGLLFLSADSAIRALAGERNLRQMGGLRRRLPITFWTFLIGVWATAGIPPFSGFWSYVALLLSVHDGGHTILWGTGCVVVLLTALYGFRLFFVAFAGAEPEDRDAEAVAESPALITAPLVALAILAAGAGVVGYPWGGGLIDRMLEPALGGARSAAGGGLPFPALVAIPAGAAVGGAALAWAACVKFASDPARQDSGGVRRLFAEQCYVEAACDRLIVRPLRALASFVWDVVDSLLIDLLCVNGSALFTRGLGWALARLQTGQVGFYALVMVVGAVAVLFYAMARR